MVWFPLELTDVVMCCTQPKRVANLEQERSTQGYGTNDISLESRVRSQGDAAFEWILDPIEGSPAAGKSVAGILNLFVDDLFGTIGTEMNNVF